MNFDLLTFKESLFNFNHIDSFDNSLFISNSFIFPISVVSSAYIINLKYLLVSTDEKRICPVVERLTASSVRHASRA